MPGGTSPPALIPHGPLLPPRLQLERLVTLLISKCGPEGGAGAVGDTSARTSLGGSESSFTHSTALPTFLTAVGEEGVAGRGALPSRRATDSGVGLRVHASTASSGGPGGRLSGAGGSLFADDGLSPIAGGASGARGPSPPPPAPTPAPAPGGPLAPSGVGISGLGSVRLPAAAPPSLSGASSLQPLQPLRGPGAGASGSRPAAPAAPGLGQLRPGSGGGAVSEEASFTPGKTSVSTAASESATTTATTTRSGFGSNVDSAPGPAGGKPKPAVPDIDLQRVAPSVVAKVKEEMDVVFRMNQKPKGHAEYVYDIAVDFEEGQEATDWDE